MITPSANAFIKSIPAVWHCYCTDADGRVADAVLMSDDVTRSYGDYGITERESGDTLYVDITGFNCPVGKIKILKDGKTFSRRITSTSANPFFIMLTLGEVCD